MESVVRCSDYIYHIFYYDRFITALGRTLVILRKSGLFMLVLCARRQEKVSFAKFSCQRYRSVADRVGRQA